MAIQHISIIPSYILHLLDSYGLQTIPVICKNIWNLNNFKSHLEWGHENLIMRIPNNKESMVELHCAAFEFEK